MSEKSTDVEAFNKKYAAEIAAAQAEISLQSQKDSKAAKDYAQSFVYVDKNTEMHGDTDWKKVAFYAAQINTATQCYRHLRQEQDKHDDAYKLKADAAAQYVDILAKTAAQYEKQIVTMQYCYDTRVIFDDKVNQTLVQMVDDLGLNSKVADKVLAFNEQYLRDRDVSEALVWANKRRFDIARSRYKLDKHVKPAQANGHNQGAQRGGRGGRN